MEIFGPGDILAGERKAFSTLNPSSPQILEKTVKDSYRTVDPSSVTTQDESATVQRKGGQMPSTISTKKGGDKLLPLAVVALGILLILGKGKLRF